MLIKFQPSIDTKTQPLLRPIPAIQSLPEWYKKLSPYTDGSKKQETFPDATKNITIKRCNPFADALGSGYFILLENDIEVTIADGSQKFVWLRGGNEFVSEHTKRQISMDLIPEGYNEQPYKFANFWGIETPPGYSTLFTHPMNRTELPFLTLSGIVDTDDYTQPVNFPFVIKKNFEGILESGTPIAQLIPFRRDNWKAEIEDFDAEKVAQGDAVFKRKIHRPYKLGYWKKKSYK